MVPHYVTPGVYVEESPNRARGVSAAATSVTAFVGRTWRGLVNQPIALSSFAAYEREFGGLSRDSSVSYAVQQFFLNGGAEAIVVRVVNADIDGSTAAAPATVLLRAGTTLVAASPGTWGRNLRVSVDHKVSDATDASLFNLTILDDPSSQLDSAQRGGSGLRETFLDVSMHSDSERFITKILLEQSALVRVGKLGRRRPAIQSNVATLATSGSDGLLAGTVESATQAAAREIIGDAAAMTGMHALRNAGGLNLLCIPPLVFSRATSEATSERIDIDVPTDVWRAAATLCTDQRAMLIVDAPRDWDVQLNIGSIKTFRESIGAAKNVALYFPRLRMADPLNNDQPQDFAPCGAMAGVFARTDASVGVWKAPAGINASINGAMDLSVNGRVANVSDAENAKLNSLGINCLRKFPGKGIVAWGARTLEGADQLASEWKYVPVRRLALFIQQSLLRGTQWARFEPNEERTWSPLRADVGAFLHAMFVNGAFQGATSREGFFVRCDAETTSASDIDNGIVNILIGFAPLKPAEFVLLNIQQTAMRPGE